MEDDIVRIDMKAFLLLPAVLLTLLVSACSSAPTADRPYRDVAEAAEAPENPAVTALRAEADRQMSAGNSQLAANALERAIRISPHDARLRVELAEVRLREGNAVQAKALARMAVAFSRTLPDIQADAWEVIGRAESRLGNRKEADLAFDEARRVREEQ